MSDILRSVGLDVGTTSTQMIFSELTVENKASGFAVPEMEIARRDIRYRSPVYFTPLLDESHVDAEALRELVAEEYRKAGIRRESVDTGAIIITGETSRKENARAVLDALSDFAGEFVVATAGPDLESVLAAKGAGAVDYSQRTGKTVLHMDIGGGTSNLALIQYVQLLFAGAADCDDTRQEILQNTLDRYDDLIAAGKTPEAAYRLAIMGIGDINEILGRTSGTPAVMPVPAVSQEKQDTPTKKILRAIGVGLYILCPLPLFSDGGTDGLCGTLIFIAIATALVILGAKKEGSESKSGTAENTTPETELKKSVSGLIWAVGLAIYFIVSFLTGAWYITWVIFPITAAVQGLVKAILDLKEGK